MSGVERFDGAGPADPRYKRTARLDEDECGVEAAEGFLCTRPARHRGDHAAHVDLGRSAEMVARWPRAEVAS